MTLLNKIITRVGAYIKRKFLNLKNYMIHVFIFLVLLVTAIILYYITESYITALFEPQPIKITNEIKKPVLPEKPPVLVKPKERTYYVKGDEKVPIGRMNIIDRDRHEAEKIVREEVERYRRFCNRCYKGRYEDE
jgi:hypothetical protein